MGNTFKIIYANSNRFTLHLGSIFEITDVKMWGSDHIEMSSGAQSRVEQTVVINGVSGR